MAFEEAVTGESSRSVRDELLAARDEVAAREAKEPESSVAEETTVAAPSERPRAADGKFLSRDATEAHDSAPEPTVAEPEPVAQREAKAAPEPAQAPTEAKSDEFTPAPQSWSNSDKALWKDIPNSARQVILKREQDVHRALTAQDEERQVARQYKEVARPYEALLQSQGATPIQAFQEFLKTAYVMYSADPVAKQNMLRQVAARHGVQFAGGQASAQPQYGAVPPQVMQELTQLRQQVDQFGQTQQQAQLTTAMSSIETFRGDPAHKYFDAVSDHMATLINTGAATSLQDAYEQATWGRPDIRSQLLAEQQAQPARINQARQKAERARAKSVSVRGGPGNSAPPAASPNSSVRDDILAAMAEAGGRI